MTDNAGAQPGRNRIDLSATHIVALILGMAGGGGLGSSLTSPQPALADLKTEVSTTKAEIIARLDVITSSVSDHRGKLANHEDRIRALERAQDRAAAHKPPR